VGGWMRPSATTVKTFTIAGVPIPRVQFMVGGSETGSVGLLGQNVLALADVEFDLGHGMIKLMKSVGCAKADLAYWVKPDEVYSILATERQERERPHIIASILVNGVKLRALLDTGASTSFVSLKAAARIGLKPDGEGVKPAGISGGIGRGVVSTWIGPVKNITIGDEQINNTRLRFGGELVDVDMLLGADFFLSHHVYWAQESRKLYFTFNGGHVFDLHYLRGDGDLDDAPATAPAVANAGPEPTDAEGFSRRGHARAARGDVAGGLADLDRALALAPDSADYLQQRANFRAGQGQTDKALDDLNHLLKIKPNDVDGLLMRAGLRRVRDHDADVRADIDAAAAAAAKSSDRRLEIGGFYDALAAYPQGIEQYDLWIAAHPDDNRRPMALNGRCWARAMTGQELDRALKDCNAALAARPHTPAFLDSRGLVRVRTGDYARAIADYDEALTARSDMAWSYYGRGIAKLRLGQKEAGEADLAKARKIDPKVPETAAKLGVAP
jgi:tetratricopeptide (TPR) repeat protein